MKINEKYISNYVLGIIYISIIYINYIDMVFCCIVINGLTI